MSRSLLTGGVQISKQPINQLLFVSPQMEATPHLKKEGNAVQQSPDTFEKDYNDFIELAAHELDAPLRKLTVLVEMLTNKFETPSQDKGVQSYIERIDGCVNDMRSLIDELSLLAKVRTDKRNYASCDIKMIIREVLEELEVPLNAKKAIVTVSALPVLDGDAGQYNRLFKSLLENAIRFSKEDVRPEIQIQSSVLSLQEANKCKLREDKKYYKIELADNGIGFKNEYAEKIFRPFVRLHGKSKFAGSGMGLAICKKIVENHHGIIYAEGRENEGSRFILVLPETH